VGDGWYGLHHGGRGLLGLKAQLHVEYASGRSDVIATGPSWKVTDRSPIRMSDIYNGESYDARSEIPGWTAPGFDDSAWQSPVVDFAGLTSARWKDVTEIVRSAVKENRLSVPASNDLFGDPVYGLVKTLRVSYRTGTRVQQRRASEGQTLTIEGGRGTLTIVKAEYGADATAAGVSKAVVQAHPGSPVRVTGSVPVRTMTQPRPGVFVFDLGQNLSGWARLRVTGPRGSTVTMRFAEMLNPDGTIYTTNLRGAKCTDRYTLRGGTAETWEPRFTFHGFRYVEVTGYPGIPPKDAITGVVLNSDCGVTGRWSSSSPLLNRLYDNIVWGMRSNYLEVPTDCPQRDERMGWSGDAQVFVGTGAYCMDIAPFFTAWMRTFNDSQTADGGYPNISPRGGGTSPAWGDAGLICPWEMYRVYGDRRVLAEHYDGMKRWVEYLRSRSSGLLRPAEGFGDWLNVQDDTPKDVIATAFFARSADLLSRIAGVLGKKDDEARYRKLFADIGAAFTRAYVTDSSDPTANGRIKGNSQTAYLMALQFDVLPERMRRPAFDRLVDNIEAHGGRLTVGFVGVDLLLPTLSRFGRPDLAWRLLTNRDYPSWLYSVTQGATTIWERWDGWRHDKGFQDPGMNSFNHCAFGACGKWMFSDAAGIASAGDAFRRIVIKPTIGGGLGWVKAAYHSVRGDIASEWRVSGGRLTVRVTTPANTTAEVHVPARAVGLVREGGRPADRAPGVRAAGMREGRAVFVVGGGTYEFSAPVP
jgi:alpha-L-rhamnosidase